MEITSDGCSADCFPRKVRGALSHTCIACGWDAGHLPNYGPNRLVTDMLAYRVCALPNFLNIGGVEALCGLSAVAASNEETYDDIQAPIHTRANQSAAKLFHRSSPVLGIQIGAGIPCLKALRLRIRTLPVLADDMAISESFPADRRGFVALLVWVSRPDVPGIGLGEGCQKRPYLEFRRTATVIKAKPARS